MCNKCGQAAPINANVLNRIQEQNAKVAMSASAGLQLATGIIGILLSGSNNDDRDYTYKPRTKDKEEAPEEEILVNKENLEKLLGKDTYDNLSEDLQEDILSKYDVLKSVRKLDDETIKARLNTYIKASQEGEQKTAVKNFIETTLKDANIKYDNTFIENIIEKHNLLELFDPKGNDESKNKILQQKIIDYANGTNYVTAEYGFNGTKETSFIHQSIKQAIDNNDNEAYKKAHLQFGREMVEVYDIANPDEKIDFVEYAAYQTAISGVENPTEEMTEAALLSFKIHDMNSDGYIDQNEMSADLWATATILDTTDTPLTSHEITKDEYKKTELGKTAYGAIMLMTEYSEGWSELDNTARESKYKEAFATLNTEEQEAYKLYATVRKNSIDAFLPQE